MTKAKVRVQAGKAWIEVEASNVKEAMQGIGEYAEVFKEDTCQCCQSTNVIPIHRNAQGYDFYEMVCCDCGAKLSYGQTREGGRLFPKRSDKDGNYLPNMGWHKYSGGDTF